MGGHRSSSDRTRRRVLIAGVAFNLGLRKQVGRLDGQSIRALDHGFLVDDRTLYDAVKVEGHSVPSTKGTLSS